MKLILSIAVLLTASSAVLAETTNPFFKTDFYKNTFSLYSTRIVGGEDAADPIPYIGSLRYQLPGTSVPTTEKDHICGAILLDDTTAVTAKSCVNENAPENYKVVWGILKLTDGTEVAVDKIITCSTSTKCEDTTSDIAIIKFENKVTGSNVKPIRLLTGGQCVTNLNDPVTLFGWGYKTTWSAGFEENLQQSEFNRISKTDCEIKLKNVLGDVGPNLLKNDMICVIDGNKQSGKPDKSACIGDVGGPLVIKDNAGRDKDALVGIMSWGIIPCGVTDAPSVFINVCEFEAFITDNLDRTTFPL